MNKKYSNAKHLIDLILCFILIWFIWLAIGPGESHYVVHWSTSKGECVKVVKWVDGKPYPADCFDLKNLNITKYEKVWVK